MNTLLLRTLCLVGLTLWAAPQSHAQNLSVTPTSVWIGGNFQVTLKATSWTDWLTGQSVSPENAPPATSGYYTFPAFSSGGLACSTNLYWPIPGELRMTLYTSGSGEYHVTSGSEDITVTVVDLADMQKDLSDPIKIGTNVTFTVTTIPTGTAEPSSLLWYGDATGSGLTGNSSWTNGGSKVVFAMSDCPPDLGFVYKQMSVDVFELVGLTVDNEYPDVGEQATWTATLIPYDRADVVDWSTNGTPTGQDGLTFARSFPKEEYGAPFTAKAACGSSTFEKMIWLERVEIVFTNTTTAQFVGGPTWTLTLTNSSVDVTWVITGPFGATNITGPSATVDPGPEPGMITVVVYPDRVTSRTAVKDLWAVRLRVIEASLVSNGSFAPVLDDNGNPYPRPLWTDLMDAADKVKPVQYKRDTGIKVNAEFNVEPGAWDGTVKVKALGDYPLEQQDFTAAGGEMAATDMQAEAGKELSNFVHWKPNFECPWKCSVDGGTHFGDAMKSRHAVYVTLDQPKAKRHTVVHLACKNAGAAGAVTALQKVWQSFDGPADTKTWDDNPMYYYQPGVTVTPGALADWEILVSSRNGDCDSWSKLMAECLDVHNLSGSSKRIRPNASIVPSPSMVIATPIPTTNVFGDPIPAGAYWEPRWLIKINCGTGAGQNVAVPAHEFFHHAITTVTVAGSETYIYDPSYGKLYSGSSLEDSRKLWHSSAIWQVIWRVDLVNAAGTPITEGYEYNSAGLYVPAPKTGLSAQTPSPTANETVLAP